MARFASTLTFGTLTALLAIACGSSDDSSFGDGTGANGDNANGQGSAFDTNGTNGSAGALDPVSAVGKECAGTSAGLNGLPLQLLVVLDRSGSMCEKAGGGNGSCNDADSKWKQTTAGLSAFFASEKSKGITATVIPFPPVGGGNSCEAGPYSSPDPKLIADLPNASSLSSAIEGLGQANSTPTVGALKGAVAYADSIASKGKVAIIVATDGQPNSCSTKGGPADIDLVSNIASGAASKYKTYAIGIGNSGNLDKIAAAGGTGTAYATNDTASLETALSTIRGAALTCDYSIPAAPAGQILDFRQVNVVYTTKDDKAILVKHSADCSDASGWRYDDEAAPKQILLCDGVCGTVKGDTVKKLDVVLGCATSGGPGVN